MQQLIAAEILNSRGNPTVEVTAILSDNAVGVASAPSGASVGSYEALEIRDQDEKRYHGMGVLKAIENINKTIAPALIGKEAHEQSAIDKIIIELDGTHSKARLGSNATLPVSTAICKAAARSAVMPLFLHIRQFFNQEQTGQTGPSIRIPTPMLNLLNGGKHAGGSLDFQEFLVIPASMKPYSEALMMGEEIYNSLKNLLTEEGSPTLVGDEGGYGPRLNTNTDAFALLKRAIEGTTYRFGSDVFLGMDAAANTLYKDQHYLLRDKALPYSADDLIAYYGGLNKQYHILYIEDPLYEDDWESWAKVANTLSKDTLIVGDDLIATNPYRLQMAIDKKAVSGVVIKPNQIGTVIEALAVVEVARSAGLKIIVSHRSGETNDDFIADFAVASSADYVKFGAPARGERVAKYNRLLQIERQLKNL